MQANAALTQTTTTSAGIVQQIVSLYRWLTQPHPSVATEDGQRRVRLFLSITLLSLLALTISFILIFALIEVGEDRTMFAYAFPSTLGLICALPAYLIGRTRRFALGAALMVAAVAVVSYGAMLVTPSYTTYNFTTTMIIALLLAGLFLRPKETAIAGAILTLCLFLVLEIRNDVGPILLAGAQKYSPKDVFANSIAVLNVATLTVVTLIFIRLRDMLEADRQVARERAQEKERLAEDFRRADQIKSAFLASMSHELRTPLNAVINYTKFVANGTLGVVNEEQKEVLDASAESAEHLLNLINDVLDMSKIEAGSLKLFVEDNVSVQKLLEAAVITARALLVGKPVNVILEIEHELPSLRGDRQRIMQILLNIVSNACKFTDKGDITLRAWCANDEVVIAVRDQGPGIDAKDHHLVFEAFKQTDTGLRKGGGTGLGMPISKSLAEAHGGRLWLESDTGKGAAFFVALPVSASPEIVEMAP